MNGCTKIPPGSVVVTSWLNAVFCTSAPFLELETKYDYAQLNSATHDEPRAARKVVKQSQKTSPSSAIFDQAHRSLAKVVSSKKVANFCIVQ